MKTFTSLTTSFLVLFLTVISFAAYSQEPAQQRAGNSPASKKDGTVPTITPAPSTPLSPIAKAGVFILQLDNSGSAPALEQKFVEAAWPIIERELRSMDMGSHVSVVSVGDSSLTPLNLNTRIQARDTSEGKTMDRIVATVRELVLSFPSKTHGKEHGNSQLIGGFFDASRVINPNSQNNKIVSLTDLIENSPLAKCYVDCRKLPAPTFKLPGTKVIVLGTGRGLNSDKQMQLFAAWDEFFTKTGAASVDLKRTF